MANGHGGARPGAGRKKGQPSSRELLVGALKDQGVEVADVVALAWNNAKGGCSASLKSLIDRLVPAPKSVDEPLQTSLTADDLSSPEVFLHRLAECVLDGEISPERAKTLAELVSVCKDWKLISEALNEG